MKWMRLVLDVLTAYLWPGYWIILHTYDKGWDTRLNELMAKHRFKEANDYDAMLGDQKIWIPNHPFGSMKPIAPGELLGTDIRPSRLTILRANRKLLQDIEDAKPAVQRLREKALASMPWWEKFLRHM